MWILDFPGASLEPSVFNNGHIFNKRTRRKTKSETSKGRVVLPDCLFVRRFGGGVAVFWVVVAGNWDRSLGNLLRWLGAEKRKADSLAQGHKSICLFVTDYHYFNNQPDVHLMWVDMPPFGRPGYDFIEERYTYVD